MNKSEICEIRGPVNKQQKLKRKKSRSQKSGIIEGTENRKYIPVQIQPAITKQSRKQIRTFIDPSVLVMSSSESNQGVDNSTNKNNFFVCVRIRPTSSPSYDSQGHVQAQKYIRQGPENSILLVQPHSTQGDKVFIYDEVFDNQSQTNDIFHKIIKPNLQESLFKGFSHTILVYGMTGSGKTYTMFGETFSEGTQTVVVNLGGQGEISGTEQNDVDGPMYRKVESDLNNYDNKGGIVAEAVKLVLENQTLTRLKMSYLEIYNESVRDLLSNESITSENLVILEDPDKGVHCPLLSEKNISNVEQISQLIRLGNKRRVMASTKLNQFSSRSHAIIQLSIEIEMQNDGKITTFLTPKLYLVDLAGSERVAATESKGVRLKEGANINKSLLSLGNCITVLSTQDNGRKKHVPYRDSKLTRLLKESLGGNAKTLFIACVTPAYRFVEETVNTLKYAQRAKNIKKEVYENVKQIYNQLEKLAQVKEMSEEIQTIKDLYQKQQMDLIELHNSSFQISQQEAEGMTIQQRLDGYQSQPPTEEEVLKSSQFQNHKKLFQEQFLKLSEHFEDILFRNRELECNLEEYTTSREQGERQVHEIMDTINPSSLTQKEIKYRLEKVNNLRGIIKQNEEVISKLRRELADNENMKETIKRELQSLYDVKFIKECQELSNYQLFTTFEQEKNYLKQQIDALLLDKQHKKEEEQNKEQQISKLREEITNIKKKAQHSQILLKQQQQQQVKSRSRGRNDGNLNIRDTGILTASKITPRNISQTYFNDSQNKQKNTNLQVPSNISFNQTAKQNQFSTFVPSRNMSINSVRGKSANLRQSSHSSTRNNKKIDVENSNKNNQNFNFEESHFQRNQNQKSQDIGSGHTTLNSKIQDQMSPTTNEFEEYKRKEYIIESQLKNLTKNTSFKNVAYGSRVFSDVVNPHISSGSPQIFHSPTRQQSHPFKSSFKSSFIDLAASSLINMPSCNENSILKVNGSNENETLLPSDQIKEIKRPKSNNGEQLKHSASLQSETFKGSSNVFPNCFQKPQQNPSQKGFFQGKHFQKRSFNSLQDRSQKSHLIAKLDDTKKTLPDFLDQTQKQFFDEKMNTFEKGSLIVQDNSQKTSFNTQDNSQKQLFNTMMGDYPFKESFNLNVGEYSQKESLNFVNGQQFQKVSGEYSHKEQINLSVGDQSQKGSFNQPSNSLNFADYSLKNSITYDSNKQSLYSELPSHKNSSNIESYSQKSSFSGGGQETQKSSSTQSQSSLQFLSPKLKALQYIQQQQQQQISNAYINSPSSSQQPRNLSKPHSQNSSSQSADEKSSKPYSGMFSPIMESLQEHSVLNLTGQLSEQPSSQKQPHSQDITPSNQTQTLQKSSKMVDPVHQKQNFIFTNDSLVHSKTIVASHSQGRNKYPTSSHSNKSMSSNFHANNQKGKQLQLPISQNTTNHKASSSSNCPSSYQKSSHQNRYQMNSSNDQPRSDFSHNIYTPKGSPTSMMIPHQKPTIVAKINSISSIYNTPYPHYDSPLKNSLLHNIPKSLENFKPQQNCRTTNSPIIINSPNALKQHQMTSRISNPSFNNYMQNRSTYETSHLQLQGSNNNETSAPPTVLQTNQRTSFVPTAAITLNLEFK